jgi:hypothetical protein
VPAQILRRVLALPIGVVPRRTKNSRSVLPCAVVVSIDIVDFDQYRVAVRLIALRCGPPIVRIGVRDDEHPVAKRDPGPVPTSTPQFGAAEGRTQPVDGLLHVNVDEFRDHAGRSGRAIDQHDGPPHRIAAQTLTADAPRATGPRTTIQSMPTHRLEEDVAADSWTMA